MEVNNEILPGELADVLLVAVSGYAGGSQR